MADEDKTAKDASGSADDKSGDANATTPKGSDDAKSADSSSSGSDSSADGSSGGSSGGSPEGGSTSDGSSPSTGGDAPAAPPASTPPLSTALNPQIVQAVGTTNHAVLNGAIPGANGVAYQKVAQAAAYAVQDSTDYMRNIMSMASATTGVAMQKMLATKEVDPYADIIKAATQAVTDAQKTFAGVGEAASGVVKDFDSLA